MMMLFSYVQAHHLKFQNALFCVHQAHAITAEIDQKVPRNLDYILAVNLMTAYLLLKIQKVKQAIEFLEICEEATDKLIVSNLLKPCGYESLDDAYQKLVEDKQGSQPKQVAFNLEGETPSDYMVKESTRYREEPARPSKISQTMLMNCLLCTSLMKSMALRFTVADNEVYEQHLGFLVVKIRRIEEVVS